jgi:uncharacterized membrane protein
MERANQVRDVVADLAWGTGNADRYLILLDIAVVVRHPDGSFTVNRHGFPSVTNILASTGAGLLAGLVLAAPLTGATVGALLGSAGSVAASRIGISEEFVRDVEAMMKPGTSTLFVLDDAADMEVILHTIRGLGGRVLKSNVDLDRVRLIQSELAATAGSQDQ